MEKKIENFLYRNPKLYDHVFNDYQIALSNSCKLVVRDYMTAYPQSILDIGRRACLSRRRVLRVKWIAGDLGDRAGEC